MRGERLKVKDIEKVPLTPEARIRGLMELPNKSKQEFLPPVGFEFQLGPYIYKVTIHNVGQMRFTAKLSDVVVEGINDN